MTFVMKVVYWFFSCLLLTASMPAQTITDSLQLHYPMDGNALDASGNGFDGTPNATLTEDRLGNPDAAYYFNGIDQYIDWPNEAALKPELPISMSAWVNLDVVSLVTGYIVVNDYAQNTTSGVVMNISSTGRLAANYGDGTANYGPSYRRTKVGDTELVAGVWYHVAIVVRGAQDMDLYVDCNNDGGTYNGTGGPLDYTDLPGSVGRGDAHYWEPAYYYQGKIDDVRFWNRALTEQDIAVLMAPECCGFADPGCDDGDESNGVEVWDGCACIEGEPEIVIPQDPIDDPALNCESWNWPNVFSPNGDGINDLFRMASTSSHSIKTLMIFDRWGKLIFESNADDASWDGTYKGEVLPLAAYVFVVEGLCDQAPIVKQGSVILIR